VRREGSLALAGKTNGPNIGSGPFDDNQNRNTLNGTHVPFDFFWLPLCFFAMALLLDVPHENSGALQVNAE
jgi:hypothetical protein